MSKMNHPDRLDYPTFQEGAFLFCDSIGTNLAPKGASDSEAKKFVSDRFRVWYEAIADLVTGWEYVLANKRLCAKAPTFWKDNNNYAALIMQQVDHIRQTNAVNGWQSALAAVSTVGPWRSVSFEDHTIMETILFLNPSGWPDFCSSLTEKTIPFRRKEFIEAYAAIAGREWIAPTVPDQRLVGFHALNARSTGRPLLEEDQRPALVASSSPYSPSSPRTLAAGRNNRLLNGNGSHE